MLFPPKVRQLFKESIASLGSEQGLRIRLVHEDPQLADLPWEYLHLPLSGDAEGLDGFLAMDPRLSIVRYDPFETPEPDLVQKSSLRVLAGFASPEDQAGLDLDEERGHIEKALSDIPGIELVDFVEHLTTEKLEHALRQQIDIFHFAGHGVL